MHALAGMTVEWSDDEGETWGPFGLASFATGYSVQDHQTIASLRITQHFMKQHGYFASMKLAVSLFNK